MESVDILVKESLAPRTSLGLGGCAEFFVEVSTVEELANALNWAKAASCPVSLLGGGSNVVIADEGLAGLVIVPNFRGLDFDRCKDGVLAIASAGEVWDEIVAETVSQGLLGLECLSGIPGTVGATPIQNVGAYGVEVSDVIEWVEVFDRNDGTENRMLPTQCSFGYRTSCFRKHADRWVVTRVAFKLQSNSLPVIRYPELKKAVDDRMEQPDGQTVRDVVMTLRQSKGMVLEDGAPGSVGSFFINPIVDNELLAEVEAVTGPGDPVPRYPAAEGLFKIPAAWLIEGAGFCRGYRQGEVGISEHHALALVHHSGGRTRDLLALASSIRSGVEHRFGIVLRPEPVFWGFPHPDPLNGEVP